MITFEQIWAKLYEHGACANKEEGTRRFWATLTDEQREQVFSTISSKLEKGKFVQFDPIRAIKENMPKVRKQQTLTYAEYYAKYGTTVEVDGWHMANPTGNKVIYVK